MHIKTKSIPQSILIYIGAACVLVLLAACGAPAATQAPTYAPTQAPAAAESPVTEAPSMPGPTQGMAQAELQRIDQAIDQTLEGNLAYSAPASMRLDETAAVQLLVSPALSAEALKQQISESGIVTTGSLNVTPRMKAVLTAHDPEAFVIQPVHANDEKVLSSKEPTEWRWLLQAKKGGQQRLTLTVYRLVEIDGKEDWRIKSYENTVNVKVTLLNRLERFEQRVDWSYLFGILLAALLGEAILFWKTFGKKKEKQGK